MTATGFLQRRLNMGVVSWPIWALGLILVYWLLPTDLIPDKFPIVGLLDDAAVAAGVAVSTSGRPQ